MNFSLLICWIFSLIQCLYSLTNETNSTIFLIYSPLNLCINGSLSIEFRHIGSNGLIFYTKDHNSNDSIVIRIEQKKLVYEQSIAKQKFVEQWDQILHPHRWYQLLLQRQSWQIFTLQLSTLNSDLVEIRRIFPSNVDLSPSFTRGNDVHSLVYLQGLPWTVSDRDRLFYPSFRGLIRNVRYGSCKCTSELQYPIFTSFLFTSSDHLVPLQCPALIDNFEDNRILMYIDLTSKEFQSKNYQSFFTFETDSYQFHVRQPAMNNSKRMTLLPLSTQTNTCLWDLNQCWSG